MPVTHTCPICRGRRYRKNGRPCDFCATKGKIVVDGILLDAKGIPCAALEAESHKPKIWGDLGGGGVFWGLTEMSSEGVVFAIFINMDGILAAGRAQQLHQNDATSLARSVKLSDQRYLELLGLECIKLFGDLLTGTDGEKRNAIRCDCHSDGTINAWIVSG
jgi:hypothetical protein